MSEYTVFTAEIYGPGCRYIYLSVSTQQAPEEAIGLQNKVVCYAHSGSSKFVPIESVYAIS